ncbi:2OG-Fe(II) oxygenase [Amycolatopsis solani]|uniref:2OG-Fe(II) oxygenase n=1 Tax=Amycolatopsis solani TaxID=3028615 RepID=UPI0025B074E5|nr:2OG-Fe(II) oxygenase [Amycolatopsis sp. MEP2-6]
MEVSQRGKRFVVIDGFLDEAKLASARTMLSRANFAQVDSVISPAEDGMAFRAKGIQFRDDLCAVGVGGRPAVYEELVRTVHREREFYGEHEVDWNRIAFTFWKYPAKSRLGWHDDAGHGRRGEFIVFLHETWRPSWGGELMVLDVDPEELREVASDAPVSRMEALLDACPISPVAIAPRPNRLVLVKAETVHQIHRVDETAGESLRCTLTGFVSKDVRETNARSARERMAEALGVR